jgi:hypothetical protein
MSTLAQQQQAMLAALFEWPPQHAMQNIASYAIDSRHRGLKAYQTNGHMLAERALQAAYPVVFALVGAQGFADLARALWHAHPPLRGDLAQWGDTLPAFLRNSAQLEDEPYLADVACVEWLLHSAATAADAGADLASLALLTTHDPDRLQLVLAPGCAVFASQWPVASIVLAHLTDSPTLAEAGAQLRAGVAQQVVVWREGLQPRVREAMPGEADSLQAMLMKHSLAQSLDAAPALDFSVWLPMAVRTGLVLSAQVASAQDQRA